MNETLISAPMESVINYIVRRMKMLGIDITDVPEFEMNLNAVMFCLECFSRGKYGISLCKYHQQFKDFDRYGICLPDVFSDVYPNIMENKLPYDEKYVLNEKDFIHDSFKTFDNYVNYMLCISDLYIESENFAPNDHDVMTDEDFLKFYQTRLPFVLQVGKKRFKKN